MDARHEVPLQVHTLPAETMFHDSMVTVRLSEPPTLTVDTSARLKQQEPTWVEVDELQDADSQASPKITMSDPNAIKVDIKASWESRASSATSRRASDGSVAASEEVNWEELERTEEQEPRDQDSDESTALLLARLEQENNLLAINPKSSIKAEPYESRIKPPSRPPSIQLLKKLMTDPTPPALRYSITPPPPLTDYQFYAALVQDYNRTAHCLPTLLSKKVRSGIPHPLRGMVWQSMCGARDVVLEAEFDRLCGETSPYEGIIGKDLGRSFPGVEMFRDPDGDGQQMLGRVLKCFSLYDSKIGYCQGLGFLVGPLLITGMGDKQAFCVLVRLMEHYDLRACFLPDLSGLHVRIHQFRELLKQHVPTLAGHLEQLQIEPAYLSQWFLSFFAVTCPLPMLFRVYDVVFAEGASETIMRVALALMKKNESRLMACSEFEDAMQLLLSRGLWDCYHYNADDFVNDFVSLTGIVTHESLQTLEASYKESQIPSDIGSAASRFLGRLWASKSSLSPGSNTPVRPASCLRRSLSKQSIASTLNSVEAGSDSLRSFSTDVTSLSRDSSNGDSSSILATAVTMASSKRDQGLHSQIEDLLTALSEMQRDHAILATRLQKEREDREEDSSAVHTLLDALRKKADGEDAPATEDLTSMLNDVEDRFSAVLDNRRSSMLQTKAQMREELLRSKELLRDESTKAQDLARRISDQEQQVHNLEDEVREGHTHLRNAHVEKQRLEKQVHDLRARRSVSLPDRGPDQTESKSSGGLRELKLGRQNSASRSAASFSKRSSSLAQVHDPAPSLSDVASDHDALVQELVQRKTSEAVARQEAEEAKAKLDGLRKMLVGNGDVPKEYRLDTAHKPSTSQASASATVGGAWASWSGWGKRVVSEKVGGGG